MKQATEAWELHGRVAVCQSRRCQVLWAFGSQDLAFRSVRAFLEKQRALGKLLYPSGPKSERRTLWKRFQILSSLESGEDTLHSAPVRIYDSDGAGCDAARGADLSEDNLLHDIRSALAADGDTKR